MYNDSLIQKKNVINEFYNFHTHFQPELSAQVENVRQTKDNNCSAMMFANALGKKSYL